MSIFNYAIVDMDEDIEAGRKPAGTERDGDLKREPVFFINVENAPPVTENLEMSPVDLPTIHENCAICGTAVQEDIICSENDPEAPVAEEEDPEEEVIDTGRDICNAIYTCLLLLAGLIGYIISCFYVKEGQNRFVN